MNTTVKPTKIKQQTNTFKIVAIIVVILFTTMILAGLVRWYHFHNSSIPLTPDQIQATKTIALNDLAARGQDPTHYEFTILPKARIMNKETPSKLLAQAYFKNSTLSQFYLIDLNSNTIIMHSQTDYYTNLLENKNHKNPGQEGITTENREHFLWFLKR